MGALNARETVGGALALAVLLALPVSGAAQMAPESASQSWLPWTGCWTELEAPGEAPMTCIVPKDDGVELLTVSSTGITARQVLRADGVERTVTADGCTGVQAAESSADGARLYTRTTMACDGGAERTTRGLMAMVSPDEWIQVRALTVGAASASWVQRYRAAPSYRVAAAGLPELELPGAERARAVEAARIAASRAPTVDAIIEANGRTDPEAVRAWIVEHRAPVRLDADGLIRMADAGVGEEVIDVVVAVSYPERFAVAREPDRRLDDGRYAPGRDGYIRGGRGLWSPYYDPFYYSPFSYGSRYYGSMYGYGATGFGSGGYHYGSPTVIVVTPAGEGRPSGQAVKGRGYTRPGAASGGTIRPARPSAARTGGSVQGSGSSSSTSSSKGKAKAKPKGGG